MACSCHSVHSNVARRTAPRLGARCPKLLTLAAPLREAKVDIRQPLALHAPLRHAPPEIAPIHRHEQAGRRSTAAVREDAGLPDHPRAFIRGVPVAVGVAADAVEHPRVELPLLRIPTDPLVDRHYFFA